MKIAIIGAGISGCTAYLLLRKHLPKPGPYEEHTITIYEAYDTDKDTTFAERGQQGPTHSSTLVVGGGLGVAANGLNVLRRLDQSLLRDIVRGGYVTATQNLKNKDGKVLVRSQPAGDPSSVASSKNPEQNMHMLATSRHSLWRCIRVRIPDCDIVTKRVAKIVAKADGRNVVTFVDGSSPVEADLVIGADGLKSIVKLALFPEAEEDPYPAQYEGLAGIGGFIPAASAKAHVEPGSMNFVFGGNGFFGYFFSESTPSTPHRDSPYHVSEPGDTISWWSTYAVDECPDPSTIDLDAVKQQLRERHGSWKDPVIRMILQSLEVESLWPTWTVPPLPTWEREGVVLVGDAAHGLPPTSGQGSSQALEDVEALALFLAHYLRRAEDEKKTDAGGLKHAITQAARQYMDLRVPHVAGILKDARRMQGSKKDMGKVAENVMYAFMWVIGCFPSIMTKTTAKVFNYNVAEEVKRVIEKTG